MNCCQQIIRFLKPLVCSIVVQLRPGHVFNIEAGKQALRNINSLSLFSNIEVNPRPDEKSEGGIIVEIKLKELEQKSAEVSTEWSIAPGSFGRPTLVILAVNILCDLVNHTFSPMFQAFP